MPEWNKRETTVNGDQHHCRKKAGGNCQRSDMELGIAGKTRRRIPAVECFEHRGERCREEQQNQSAPDQHSAHSKILQGLIVGRRCDEALSSSLFRVALIRGGV